MAAQLSSTNQRSFQESRLANIHQITISTAAIIGPRNMDMNCTIVAGASQPGKVRTSHNEATTMTAGQRRSGRSAYIGADATLGTGEDCNSGAGGAGDWASFMGNSYHHADAKEGLLERGNRF
jgi:hypothetical protein